MPCACGVLGLFCALLGAFVSRLLAAILFPAWLTKVPVLGRFVVTPCRLWLLGTPSHGLGTPFPLGRKPRVAVIGGGIAGTAAAWSLARSGECSEVVLLEARHVLGGNAKTHDWNFGGGGSTSKPATTAAGSPVASSKEAPRSAPRSEDPLVGSDRSSSPVVVSSVMGSSVDATKAATTTTTTSPRAGSKQQQQKPQATADPAASGSAGGKNSRRKKNRRGGGGGGSAKPGSSGNLASDDDTTTGGSSVPTSARDTKTSPSKATAVPLPRSASKTSTPSAGPSKDDRVGDDCESTTGFRTGLSVLAWPKKYFRNYEVLLKHLGVPTTTVSPKFYVAVSARAAPLRKAASGAAPPASDAEVLPTWGHGLSNDVWKDDMKRWDRLVRLTRRVNRVAVAVSRVVQAVGRLLTPWVNHNDDVKGKEESLYEMTMLNPLVYIPARMLSRYLGISHAYWNCVVVPIYSSSFLTTKLNGMPAAILPALDDIISIGAADPVKSLSTWDTSSKHVFDTMRREIEAVRNCRVVCSANIRSVSQARHHFGPGIHGLEVLYDGGVGRIMVDRVIFACPATAVNTLVADSTLRSSLFNSVIPAIHYEDVRDVGLTHGMVHSNTEVLPASLREELFSKKFSNLVLLHGDPAKADMENTFILGTWVPTAVRYANASAARRFGLPAGSVVGGGSPPPCYVTYNAREGSIATQDPLQVVDNTSAHPQFTIGTILLGKAVGLLQGQRGLYYAASYTTPGNGHDLSLLSGLITASEIVNEIRANSEVYYPLDHMGDRAAKDDFKRLRAMMNF